MRWVAFILLSILALTLQSTLAPRLELLGARPDWLLLLVVLVALYAPFRDAVVGAWIIGFGADLLTIERLGFLALCYTLVAMAISPVREAVFREQLATQVVVTAIASAFLRSTWAVYRRLLYGAADGLLVDAGMDILWASVYTAAWMAVLYPAHGWLRRVLGLSRLEYRFAPLSRKGPRDV